jgi:hypothetical protein
MAICALRKIHYKSADIHDLVATRRRAKQLVRIESTGSMSVTIVSLISSV